MKKTKQKEVKQKQKEQKKRNKQLKDILSWMHIQKINNNGIYLKKGGSQQIAKGIKIKPLNILISENIEKARAIISLASGLDTHKFPIFYKFVKSKPTIHYQAGNLMNRMQTESNTGIQTLMQMQLNKIDWFCDNSSELSFYVMVQTDELHIDKQVEHIFRTFKSAGLNPTYMIQEDYENVVKEQFENDTVNEYLYSVLTKDEEVYNNVFNKK